MKKMVLIFSVSLVLLLYHNAYSADYIIEGLSILGYQKDMYSPELEEYVTQNATKLFSDEVGIMLSYPPKASCDGSFADLPCLKMFSTNLVPHYLDAEDGPYRQYIFNECDSSLYHFGGDTYRFHQIIKHYFDGGIDSKKLYNYFNLYLNTISVDDPYYILDSASYVNNILHYWWGEPVDTMDYPNSIRRNDFEWISKNIEPLYVQQEGNLYYAKLFSWEYDYGRVELWNFIISKDFLQIINRRTIIEDFGYHYPLH
jgi:hypothetical protein